MIRQSGHRAIGNMKEDYKKYGQTDYYWILEFLDSDYERSSYKKNGADIVLKMNNAENIKRADGNPNGNPQIHRAKQHWQTSYKSEYTESTEC